MHHMIALNLLLGTGYHSFGYGVDRNRVSRLPSVILSTNKMQPRYVNSLPSSLVPSTPTNAEGTRMAQMFGLATNESFRTALPTKATF